MRFNDFLDQLRPVLGEVSQTVLVFERLPSTNAYARHLVEALPDHATLPGAFALVAFEQTTGRGRRGRRWLGPPGGLYVSWAVPLERGLLRSLLPVLVATSVCDALRSVGAESCQLKWPNDLMVQGRKMGGILIELVTPRAGAEPVAIIGCGVNVATAPSDLPGIEATTLVAAAGREVDFGEVLAALSRELNSSLGDSLEAEGALERYRRVLAHRPGDGLRCSLGEDEIEGRFIGIDPTGALRLETDRGERVVSAGEVIES